MSTQSDPLIRVLPEQPLAIEDDATPRDRRQAFRVSLPCLEATFASPIQLIDISLSGVGLLARREDAPLLNDALLLVHVNTKTSLRARVQRVELGVPSKKWVRVGARFIELADEERASLSALVTSRCC